MKKDESISIGITIAIGTALYFGERMAFPWAGTVGLPIVTYFLEPGVRHTTGLIVLNLFVSFLAAIPVSLVTAGVLRASTQYKTMLLPLIAVVILLLFSYGWFIADSKHIVEATNFEAMAFIMLRPVVVAIVFLAVARLMIAKPDAKQGSD